MHFKKYILLYTILPLLFVATISLAYRFFILHDYEVSYEIECEPSTNSCYVGCEDEECLDNYFYSLVNRRSSVLYEICGKDIIDCDGANYCVPGEKECQVNYCPVESGECFIELNLQTDEETIVDTVNETDI